MKNITLNADDDLIEEARLVARSRGTTLNMEFRGWLRQFTGRADNGHEVDAPMRSLHHVDAGGRFSRDEMNER